MQDEARCLAEGGRAAQIVREKYTPEAIAPALWADLLRLPAGAGRRPDRSVAEVYATWSLPEAPEPVYVRFALLRNEARQSARSLGQAGRSLDAAQTLVRAVTSAMEARDARVMIETLLEIALDLAKYDGPRADTLLEQAVRLLGGMPANNDLIRVYQRDLANAQAAVREARRGKLPRVA